jgi:hypothetical protein
MTDPPFSNTKKERGFCMMKKDQSDKEQVVGFEGPGKAVNFFDPYPDEDKVNDNNAEQGEERKQRE